MKKVFIPIMLLFCFAILAFVVFTKADVTIVDKTKALEIGEEKYLEFLWMVDGAFNSERLDGDFSINGKELSIDKKEFTCKYKNKKANDCIGTNFEESFSKLFSKNIKYDDVYSDGIMYTWYKYQNGEYIFSNLNNCSINRMPLNHEIKLVSIKNDKLSYKVSFINNQNNLLNETDFILIFEDNEWKISTAFYYDICGLKYYIY